MIFKIFKGFKLAITIGVLITGGVLGFYAKDLLDAGVVEKNVQGIKNIGTDGFNVDMTLVVENPSKIDLDVSSVKYDAVLRETGEIVATGEITGLTLPKEKNTTINASPRIRWMPSASLVAQYATKDEIWMDINLDITLYDFLPVFATTVSVDIKEVFNFAENNPVSEQTEQVNDTIEDTKNETENDLGGIL